MMHVLRFASLLDVFVFCSAILSVLVRPKLCEGTHAFPTVRCPEKLCFSMDLTPEVFTPMLFWSANPPKEEIAAAFAAIPLVCTALLFFRSFVQCFCWCFRRSIWVTRLSSHTPPAIRTICAVICVFFCAGFLSLALIFAP